MSDLATSTMTEIRGATCTAASLLRLDISGLQFPPRRGVRSLLTGMQPSRVRGRGIDLADMRPYVPGDDVRTIDWRATARSNQTRVKVFHEEREIPTFVIVDQRRPMHFGTKRCFKALAAIEAAALCLRNAAKHGDRVGLAIIGEAQTTTFPIQRSAAHLANLIQQLANSSQNSQGSQQAQQKALANEEQTENAHSWQTIFQTLLPVIPVGSQTVFISDFSELTTEDIDCLSPLQQRGSISLCAISDPFEHDLGSGYEVALRDLDEQLFLSKNQNALRERYQKQRHQREEALKKSLLSYGMSLFQCTTATNIREQLLNAQQLSGQP